MDGPWAIKVYVMRLSLNWLRDFVKIPVPPEVLADRLTMAGFEVEGLEEHKGDFQGVVVGRVTKVEPHPQADRLQVTEVWDGKKSYQVVCGAPNVQAGRLYPFAPPGARIAGGREIKAVQIRGVTSHGMLLAEDELGVSPDHTTLMDIPQDLIEGQDLAAALDFDDVVLEVAVLPNRPDCLSVLGLAREVAAIFQEPLRYPVWDLAEASEPVGSRAKVSILAPVHCPRYAARLVVDLTVRPSPFWLRRRLQLSGLRPINNLVDVTNYVLWEMGQPLHAFDFERLAEGAIVVRLPKAGEKSFITLDSQERLLDKETLLICDAEKPVALAGIMGGQESEVTDHTRQVLIESAYFNPRTIRRAAKRLGMSTEASYRFERGVDPEGVIRALDRAAHLMALLGGGSILAGRLDEYPQPIFRPRLTLRVSRANAVLGTSFSKEKIMGILHDLHLPAIAEADDVLAVQTPSFRGDLTREEDLIEEIARMAGYDEIPVTLPTGEMATARPGPEIRLRQRAESLLLGQGFYQAVTYSFQPERLWGLTASGDLTPLPLYLANPLSEEQALMRTSLLPGLLDALRRNILRQNLDVRLFELAKVFIPQEGEPLPQERPMLAGVMCGCREEPFWQGERQPLDFFDLKGVVETLLEGLGVDELSFQGEGLPPYLLYGARVYAGKTDLGFLGELTPRLVETLEAPGAVFVFNLFFDALTQVARFFPLYTPLPRYPAVYRDVALVLPKETSASKVTAALLRFGQPWLEEARLFDVYSGPPVPVGKRSLAFRLSYRDPERTLTDELVNRHHQKLIEAITRELGAELR